MMKYKYLINSTALILIFALVVMYQYYAPSVKNNIALHAETAVSQAHTTKGVLHQEQLRNKQAIPAASFQQVASLQGTLPDGAVNIDHNGDVVADKDLHRMFDYFLSATGEMTQDQIRSRLLSVASDFLSLDQLEQLRDLFDQYVDYLSAAERFALSQSDAADITERLHAIIELRQEVLGPELAAAFFAEEEAYAKYVLNDHGILSSDVAEQQVMKWLTVEAMATEFHDVLIENESFNELQITAAERMIVRNDRYGAQVTQNLAALDAKNRAWQDKVSQYIELRTQLADNSDMLHDLELSYDDRELKRLRAYYQQAKNAN